MTDWQRAVTQSVPWRLGRYVAGSLRLHRECRRWANAGLNPQRPVLLVINHFLDNEIEVLRVAGADEQMTILPVHHWDIFSRGILTFPKEVQADHPGAPADLTIYSSEAYTSAVAAARRDAEIILDDLEQHAPLGAVLVSSDIFWWARGFLEACRDRGVPVIVYDKEGVLSRADRESIPPWVKARYPPICDYIYVWNKQQIQFWRDRGYNVDQIHVLGALRTDAFVRMPPPNRKAVLFFDFDPESTLLNVPVAERQKITGDWSGFKSELHQVILDAARRHKGVGFTIKFHPQQTDIQEMEANLKKHAPPNVTWSGGSKGVADIIRAHSMAIGFQTTALMETTLAHRDAVYCSWGNEQDALRPYMLPYHEGGFGIHWCQDAGSLRDMVDAHIAGEASPSFADATRISEFFHSPDGHAAARYIHALQQHMGATISRGDA